jgi:hypothetical protein
VTGPETAEARLTRALLQLAEHSAELAEVREALAGLTETLAAVRDQISGDDGPVVPYRPVPAPKWWLLDGEERAEAAGRLEGWVTAVFEPSYGQLAAQLPKCWREHPFCLFCLDWMSELFSVLYVPSKRSERMLSGQADWQLRLLPAAVEAMTAETQACSHAVMRGRP